MLKEKSLLKENVSWLLALVLFAGLVLITKMQVLFTSTTASPLVYEQTKIGPAVVKNVIVVPRAVKPEALVIKSVAPAPLQNPLPLIPPTVLNRVMPAYPSAPRLQGIEGVSVVRALVGASGLVEKCELKISAGSAELDEAALRAVSQWTFSPAAQGGAVLASWYEVPIRWQLTD